MSYMYRYVSVYTAFIGKKSAMGFTNNPSILKLGGNVIEIYLI